VDTCFSIECGGSKRGEIKLLKGRREEERGGRGFPSRSAVVLVLELVWSFSSSLSAKREGGRVRRPLRRRGERVMECCVDRLVVCVGGGVAVER